jgi:2-amino-4-hydroxy-6-hydroxymethyldihydropteridine diphosphokinase
MAERACIGLGSNLGEPRRQLERAIEALGRLPASRLAGASGFLETRPIGGPPGQSPFLNAAAVVETELEPTELLAQLLRIEREAGRMRTVHWGPRELDLDLLLHGDRIVDATDLALPHPRMGHRRFVLGPLAEVAPQAVDPRTGRTVAAMLAILDRRPTLVRPDGWPRDEAAALAAGLRERLAGGDDPGSWAVLDQNSANPSEGAGVAPGPSLVLRPEAGPPHAWPGACIVAVEPGERAATLEAALLACLSTRP